MSRDDLRTFPSEVLPVDTSLLALKKSPRRNYGELHLISTDPSDYYYIMLSLPLAKLSVAGDTDAQEQQGFTWEHFHGDLVVVVDTYGAGGDSKLIKIVQGARVRVRSAALSPHI